MRSVSHVLDGAPELLATGCSAATLQDVICRLQRLASPDSVPAPFASVERTTIAGPYGAGELIAMASERCDEEPHEQPRSSSRNDLNAPGTTPSSGTPLWIDTGAGFGGATPNLHERAEAGWLRVRHTLCTTA